jgi:hypothetical protein
MDYKDALSTITMSSKTTEMLGLGIAAIAFLLASVPVFHSGVLYADEGDHDNGGDHDNNCDNGDHGDCNHGDHDNEDHGDNGDEH